MEIPDADDNNEDATNNEFEPMAHDFAGYANFDHIMINEVDAVEDDTCNSITYFPAHRSRISF